MITATGFDKKTIQEVLADLEAAERVQLGDDINTSASSVLGQINGIVGDALTQLWEVAEAIYAAQDIDGAGGDQLDNIANIFGVTRLQPTQSTVTLSLNLGPGAVASANSVVSIGQNGAKFVIDADVLNNTADRATLTGTAKSFDYGAIQAVAGAIDTIQTPSAGWLAFPGLTSTNTEPFAITGGETLIVNGVTATFLPGDTTAALVASRITGASALSGGAVRVDSAVKTLTFGGGSAAAILGFPTVTTSFTGMNPLDAALGNDLETDSELRLRVKSSRSAVGAGTLGAIKAAVLGVPGVLNAIVTEDLVAHTFTVVYDDNPGAPANPVTLNDVITNKKPAGIGYSLVQSADQVVVVVATVKVDQTKFANATQAKNAIAAAIVAQGQSLTIGSTAIYNRFKCAPLELDGVIDVLSMTLDGGIVDVVPSPATNKLVFDTGSITITTSPAVF